MPPSSPPSPTALKRGFLFAFLRYERLSEPSLIQRCVRNLIGSDIIHVAVLPALGVGDDAAHAAITGPYAYTAFMFSGFERQPAEHVLGDPAFDYVFLPVPEPADYRRGIAFLHKLDGAGYNYLSLVLAVLPRAVKAQHGDGFPNWITDEHPFFDDLLPPAHHRHHHATTTKERIFCSQLGLLLCYACNALPHHTYDPASCLPAELLDFLLYDGHAVRAPLTGAQVLPEEGALDAS